MAALLRRVETTFVETAAPLSSAEAMPERMVLDAEAHAMRAMMAMWVLRVVQLAATRSREWSRGLVGITLRDTFDISTNDYCAVVSAPPSVIAHTHLLLSERGMSEEEIKWRSWTELARVCAPVLDEDHSVFRAKLERRCESIGIAVPRSSRDVDALVQYAFPADTESQLDGLAAWTEEFYAILARMQESGARDRMQAAFDASPEELGQAAVDAARRRG